MSLLIFVTIFYSFIFHFLLNYLILPFWSLVFILLNII